jgi:hypothetical protein
MFRVEENNINMKGNPVAENHGIEAQRERGIRLYTL